MLSQQERREIDEERAKYDKPRAALVDALKIVQGHRGWVSDESLADLSQHLEVSVHDLDAVATFYNLIFRRPVGRHVILVCDSVSCFVMGYETLRDRLSSELGVAFGETTDDGRFTLLPMPCLGACDHAPVLLVDQDLHEDVQPDGVRALLDRYD
ncbi:MAG: NADH-quinone oxidoreductase subunit NuoE [Gammaproteobacteria bacterium]